MRRIDYQYRKREKAMSRSTSVRLTPVTERQVADLKRAGYGRFSDIVRLAIDRMWRDWLDRTLRKFREETSKHTKEDSIAGK